MTASKKVHSSSSRLTDPYGKSLPKPKKEESNEEGNFPTNYVDLLQDLSKKMIQMERNQQNQ